jgi:hypothetical protein
MKKFKYCMKELRRRAGRAPLCLLWDTDGMTWRVLPPDRVQLAGYQQEDIIHRNFVPS